MAANFPGDAMDDKAAARGVGRMHYVDDEPSDGPQVVLGTDHTLRKEKDRMTKEQTTGEETADLTTLLDRNL